MLETEEQINKALEAVQTAQSRMAKVTGKPQNVEKRTILDDPKWSKAKEMMAIIEASQPQQAQQIPSQIPRPRPQQQPQQPPPQMEIPAGVDPKQYVDFVSKVQTWQQKMMQNMQKAGVANPATEQGMMNREVWYKQYLVENPPPPKPAGL